MLDTYRGGYKKALLDLRNLLNNPDFIQHGKTKKQMKTLFTSMLDLLLTDQDVFDRMLTYGYPVCVITKECECKPERFYRRNIN